MGKSNKIKYFSYKHRIRQVATKKPGVDDFIKNNGIESLPEDYIKSYENLKERTSLIDRAIELIKYKNNVFLMQMFKS